MKSKSQRTINVEDELSVDLTLHGFPICILKEFITHVVNPFYGGNLRRALMDLMEQATVEEDLLDKHIRH